MVNKERLIDNFINMVKIASPSLNERKIADYVINELTALGLEVYEDEAGKKIGGNTGNIIGILRSPGKKKVMLSAHMDTVLPCENIKPVIEDGVIKSDGTTILGGDDKAGIANIIEAIKVLKEQKFDHPEIIVVCSVAEELGLLGAKNLDVDKYAPDYSFILDSGGKAGVAIVQTPFTARGEIVVIGKSAHAGISPEKGVNALTVAAHAITKLKLGRIDSEAINIVMPEVTLKYEARSFSGEKLETLLKETEDVFKAITKKFGAKYIDKVDKGYSGYNLKSDEDIVKVFEKACESTGVSCVTKSTGGGSDSNIYSEKGYKAMTIGVGMSKVHTTEEYIEIEDLYTTTKLVVELLKEIAENDSK